MATILLYKKNNIINASGGAERIMITYEFLFIFDFRFFRGDSCRYGHGRRHGDDTIACFDWGRGAKNSPMRQSFCVFADEPRRVENACRERVFTDGRHFMGDDSCRTFIRCRRDYGRRFAVGNFTEKLWGVFDRFGGGGIVSCGGGSARVKRLRMP